MTQIKRNLTTGNVSLSLLSFAFPVFLSCLLQALYGSADAIIVGQYSDMANIAGVTQGSQLMNIITQMISGLSTGASVLIAQYVGSKQNKSLEKTVKTVFTIFIISAIILMVVMLFTNNVLARILSVNEAAVPAFISYVSICEAGLLFVFLYNCINAVLQAMGDSKHPLLFVGIACVVNVILDLLFVGFFKLGAKGAALATILAQFLSFFLSIIFLKKNNFPFTFSFKSLSVDKEKAKIIIRLGSPYMVQRFLVYCSFLAISGLANPYGLEAGSAAGIVSKINNFATIPFSAFSIGISTVSAQCIGAGNMKRARETLFKGFLMCLSFGIVLFGITQLFSETIIRAFTKDTKLIDIAVSFLCFYSLEYLLMPFTWSIHGFFTATGHTLIPSFDGIMASFVCRVPLALLFSKTLGMGLNGIAFGSALAVIGAIIPAAIFYFVGGWKKPVIKLSFGGEEDAE